MSDELQLRAIQAGDVAAFSVWMAAAEPRMRASLASFAGGIDAEAVLQEALLRVWQVAPRVEPHPAGDTLVRLGVRIARNLAIDSCRRARAVPVEPPSVDAMMEVAVPPKTDPLLREAIARCHEKLPKKPRRALTARMSAGGPDRDLAAALSMRVNTFLQNLSRARRLLADCLKRAGIDLEEVWR